MDQARLNPANVISIHALREEGDSPASYGGVGVAVFLSTPSARRATILQDAKKSKRYHFYPRPPRGGRLRGLDMDDVDSRISIHALREEGDKSGRSWARHPQNFYPRPPRGGRPDLTPDTLTGRTVFLSTPSARRATERVSSSSMFISISIHALREEGDSGSWTVWLRPTHFYPRPPRGGRPSVHPTV